MSRCFKNSDGEQQFTEEEAKEHLAEFDENGDGKWSCEEFVTFCTPKPATTDTATSPWSRRCV